MVAVAGGPSVRLTHGISVDSTSDNAVAWSPNGSLIMVTAWQGRSNVDRAFLVAPTGGFQHPVLHLRNRADIAAAWAPSGLEVALVSNLYREGLEIFGLDGTLHRHLTGAFVNWSSISFSPDGLRIYAVAVHGRDVLKKKDLYSIPVRGGRPKRLTRNHSVLEGSQTLSDSGRALRVLGIGAVRTALAISRAAFGQAESVVLALSKSATDALAASPLAAGMRAPILLTEARRLPAADLTEIRRLGASRVTVVGAVAQSVVDALRSRGLTVSRVAHSSNPYAVAAGLGERLGKSKAVLAPFHANARNAWALPLAASGFAAARRLPMLLTQPSRLPSATARAVSRMHVGSVVLVGRDKDIGPQLLRALQRRHIEVRRVRGDRYHVSLALVRRAARAGTRIRGLFLTSGQTLAGSLTAAAAAAGRNSVSLLIDGRSTRQSRAADRWMAKEHKRISVATLVGTPKQVQPIVETQLEHIL